MSKIAIVTSGFLPVPATKGGAVENLIINLLNQHEKSNVKTEFIVFSDYDEKAKKIAENYKKTRFIFIKSNKVVNILDRIIFFIAKKILKKKNSQSYRYIFRRFSYLNKVSKLLKKNSYDKVLLENHPTHYLALKWRKNYKKYENKYYYHCHNEFIGTYGCEKIIENTNKIICVSQYISYYLQNYLKLPQSKFLVLRNGIESEKFDIVLSEQEKVQIRNQFGVEKDEFLIVFVGRFVPEKGIKELVHSLEYVRNQNYKLLIVGSPLNDLKVKTDYQVEVDALIKDNDKVIFTGYIEYCKIPKIYKTADLVVLPSICNDAAPLCVIETLVSNAPLISTECGGIPEYAKDGSAILLRRDNNLVENIAKSIDLCIDNQQICMDMKDSSKIIAKEFTLERYYHNFVESVGEENE